MDTLVDTYTHRNGCTIPNPFLHTISLRQGAPDEPEEEEEEVEE